MSTDNRLFAVVRQDMNRSTSFFCRVLGESCVHLLSSGALLFSSSPINIPIFYDDEHEVLHGMFLLKTQDGNIKVLGYTARSGYSLLTLRQLAVLPCLDQQCDSLSFPMSSLLIFRMSSTIMYGIAAGTFAVHSSDGSLIRWLTHSSAVFATEFASVVESTSVVNHLGQQYVVV